MILKRKSVLILLVVLASYGIAYAKTVIWNGQVWDDGGSCALSHPSQCTAGHWTVVGSATSATDEATGCSR